LPSTTLTITGPQRAALHRQVIQNLSGIGDVYLLYEAQSFADAAALGRNFAQDLRLLDDLSWAPALDRDAFEIRMPHGDLWLALNRLRDEAEGGLRGQEERRAARESTAIESAYGRTAEVCGDLLDDLKPPEEAAR
jgi:hypothetical protein